MSEFDRYHIAAAKAHRAQAEAHRLYAEAEGINPYHENGRARVESSSHYRRLERELIEIAATYESKVSNELSGNSGGLNPIDAMVTRFLGWRLPDDFAPDGGVSFTPPPPQYMLHCWPVGTNLFTAPQARAMFEHCTSPAALIPLGETK